MIKPIPETVKSEDPMLNELQADPDDDEMFLNEDEMAEMRRSKVRKLEKLANATDNEQLQQQHPSDALLSGANGNIHVIFKRSIEQHEQHNQQQPDFGMCVSLYRYLQLTLILFLFFPSAELERALVGHNVRNLTVQWPGGQLNSNNSSDGGNDGERRSSRRKRQAPGTVWPEVLLVVDYDSFMLHGATSRDVKRYFISFWNGVDLRYKLLTHPQIRVSLAGMIVAKVGQFTILLFV